MPLCLNLSFSILLNGIFEHIAGCRHPAGRGGARDRGRGAGDRAPPGPGSDALPAAARAWFAEEKMTPLESGAGMPVPLEDWKGID